MFILISKKRFFDVYPGLTVSSFQTNSHSFPQSFYHAACYFRSASSSMLTLSPVSQRTKYS